jgi:hypothetical protein
VAESCGFHQSDEFGPDSCHAPDFQQKIAEVFVSATSADQRFDVAVDGFDDSQRHFGLAVVQDAVDVVNEHPRQFSEGLEPLPPELIDPCLQISNHGAFVSVVPKPVETFFQQAGFEQFPVEDEQLIQLLSLKRR